MTSQQIAQEIFNKGLGWEATRAFANESKVKMDTIDGGREIVYSMADGSHLVFPTDDSYFYWVAA